jgi:hypothetical protein
LLYSESVKIGVSAPLTIELDHATKDCRRVIILMIDN